MLPGAEILLNRWLVPAAQVWLRRPVVPHARTGPTTRWTRPLSLRVVNIGHVGIGPPTRGASWRVPTRTSCKGHSPEPCAHRGVNTQEVEMTVHRLRHRRDRAALARVPDRPPAVSLIQRQIESARQVGVAVDELDAQHVRLHYDARDRDAWLAVDDLCDAVRGRSTVEGDRSFESAPGNWLVIHFDYGACGLELRPGVPENGRNSGPR